MAELYLTAFGSFEGVDENPTVALLERLKAELSANEKAHCRLVGATVLPVDAHAVRSWLADEFYPGILAPRRKGSDDDLPPALVLHLGVDVTASAVRLETRAVNEARFRCPDRSGWQPSGEAIEPDDDVGAQRTTDLPIAVLTGLLRAAGQPVEQSVDAGRFVCNWTYYLSLGHAWAARQERNVHVLFVHLPPLETLSLDRATAALKALIKEAAGTLAGSPSNLDDGIEAHIDVTRLPSMIRALGSGIGSG